MWDLCAWLNRAFKKSLEFKVFHDEKYLLVLNNVHHPQRVQINKKENRETGILTEFGALDKSFNRFLSSEVTFAYRSSFVFNNRM